MALNFNGINQSQIAITGGVTLTKQSVTVLAGTATANATTTVGTVPGGKVWRLIYAQLTDNCGNGTHTNMKLQAKGAIILELQTVGTATANVFGYSCLNLDYNAAVVLAAGETLQTIMGAGMVPQYCFAYVQEDA